MQWLLDHPILLPRLPKSTLARTQSHLPTHHPADRQHTAAHHPRLPRREPRQGPPEIRLGPQRTHHLDGVPSSPNKTSPRQCAPKRTPHRAEPPIRARRFFPSIHHFFNTHRPPLLHPRLPRPLRDPDTRLALQTEGRSRRARRHPPMRWRESGHARRGRPPEHDLVGLQGGLGACCEAFR